MLLALLEIERKVRNKKKLITHAQQQVIQAQALAEAAVAAAAATRNAAAAAAAKSGTAMDGDGPAGEKLEIEDLHSAGSATTVSSSSGGSSSLQSSGSRSSRSFLSTHVRGFLCRFHFSLGVLSLFIPSLLMVLVWEVGYGGLQTVLIQPDPLRASTNYSSCILINEGARIWMWCCVGYSVCILFAAAALAIHIRRTKWGLVSSVAHDVRRLTLAVLLFSLTNVVGLAVQLALGPRHQDASSQDILFGLRSIALLVAFTIASSILYLRPLKETQRLVRIHRGGMMQAAAAREAKAYAAKVKGLNGSGVATAAGGGSERGSSGHGDVSNTNGANADDGSDGGDGVSMDGGGGVEVARPTPRHLSKAVCTLTTSQRLRAAAANGGGEMKSILKRLDGTMAIRQSNIRTSFSEFGHTHAHGNGNNHTHSRAVSANRPMNKRRRAANAHGPNGPATAPVTPCMGAFNRKKAGGGGGGGGMKINTQLMNDSRGGTEPNSAGVGTGGGGGGGGESFADGLVRRFRMSTASQHDASAFPNIFSRGALTQDHDEEDEDEDMMDAMDGGMDEQSAAPPPSSSRRSAAAASLYAAPRAEKQFPRAMPAVVAPPSSPLSPITASNTGTGSTPGLSSSAIPSPTGGADSGNSSGHMSGGEEALACPTTSSHHSIHSPAPASASRPHSIDPMNAAATAEAMITLEALQVDNHSPWLLSSPHASINNHQQQKQQQAGPFHLAAVGNHDARTGVLSPDSSPQTVPLPPPPLAPPPLLMDGSLLSVSTMASLPLCCSLPDTATTESLAWEHLQNWYHQLTGQWKEMEEIEKERKENEKSRKRRNKHPSDGTLHGGTETAADGEQGHRDSPSLPDTPDASVLPADRSARTCTFFAAAPFASPLTPRDTSSALAASVMSPAPPSMTHMADTNQSPIVAATASHEETTATAHSPMISSLPDSTSDIEAGSDVENIHQAPNSIDVSHHHQHQHQHQNELQQMNKSSVKLDSTDHAQGEERDQSSSDANNCKPHHTDPIQEQPEQSPSIVADHQPST